jgi:predicted CoA-binding protein
MLRDMELRPPTNNAFRAAGVSTDHDYSRIFADTRTIAVVGISDTEGKAGNYVPAYLKDQGFRILGVTPRGENSVAEKTATTLEALDEQIDMVVLFRRSDKVPKHLDDILGLEPLPKVVWMQRGIRNPSVAAQLKEKGVEVVQDRCTMVEHRRLPSG